MTTVKKAINCAIDGLNKMSALIDLFLRLWIANVFWKSGLTKIASWDTTLALFENEYHVPFFSPEVAAAIGTSVELAIPVFLLLGLGTRFAAIILFVFNIVAAISYPELSEAGRDAHIYWGIMILVIIFHGPGKISIDHLIAKKFRKSE